jgi:hypothetical protein
VKTTAEWLAIKASRQFTDEERRQLFGDVDRDQRAISADYEADLVRRLDAGLPLSKDAAKRARRLKREHSL